MNSWDWIATALLGYLSVPLVSLSTRKHWPEWANFSVALGLALGFAVMEVWLHNDPLTQATILAAFGITFAAEQVTWHLKIPGAGTPVVNEALLNIAPGTAPGDGGASTLEFANGPDDTPPAADPAEPASPEQP